MSQESDNTKVVQQTYAAYLRGDIEGILSNLSPSITFTVPGTGAVPVSGTRRGHGQMREFFTTLANTLDFTRFDVQDYLAQGKRVLALVRYEGRNRKTGRNFAVDSAMLWTVEDGKIVNFQEYTDTEAIAMASQPAGTSAGGAH